MARILGKLQRSSSSELEACILDAPGDLDAWQVYADSLLGHGDVWGKRLILALQRAKSKGTTKSELDKQIQDYDETHAEALYGGWLAALMATDDFERVARLDAPYGLILGARVKMPDYGWKGVPPNMVLAALVKSPAARLLRSLTIGLLEFDSHYSLRLANGIETISKTGKLESLRELFIGDFEYPAEIEISWVYIGNVGQLLPVVPNLRSLKLRGADIMLGTLEHPTLESLTIETGGLPSDSVASIGMCELPQLRRMEVWLGTAEYGGDGEIRQLEPLFEGSGVPKLEHLGLLNSDFEDDIAAALCRSKLLPQLRSVDLSMGSLHEPGVDAILANIDKFAHLDSLVLDENFIPDHMCKELRTALGTKVSTVGQREPNCWDGVLHYYTTVGE